MAEDTEPGSLPTIEGVSSVMDRVVNIVELAAAALFALLFAVGVFDLGLGIFRATQSGRITDPEVVVGFIDVGLLLLIIVEVYQTVVAYIRENDTRVIVRLVIYTGVIALVRKIIIFRVSEYGSSLDAILAAGAYGILIVGIVGLLYAEQMRIDDG